MSYKTYFAILALSVAALAAVWVWIPGWKWEAALIALQAIVLFLLYRSVKIPLESVENGMYLLREQDFSTKLRVTGQKDADKVVELFNGLISTMKAERLRTLEQENFLEHLIRTSPMGIAICDFSRNVMRSNDAFNRLVTPSVAKRLGELREGETAVVRPGATQVIRCSRLWFMDSGFKRPYFLVEQLTDEVLSAETNVFNKIVRTMGHEVNNTLGSVVSVLETVESLYREDEGVREAVASSRERCLSLVSFVRSYSDIVKLPEPELKAVDLHIWIEGLRPFLAGMCAENIKIDFEHEGKESEVLADPMLMERVVVNVVKNAVESIGRAPGGKITVTTSARAITVADNGPGISQENAARLFTPFFSTKKADRGLGLMLVSEVLRRHKAAFSLVTDEKDGLTRFKIVFR